MAVTDKNSPICALSSELNRLLKVIRVSLCKSINILPALVIKSKYRTATVGHRAVAGQEASS